MSYNAKQSTSPNEVWDDLLLEKMNLVSSINQSAATITMSHPVSIPQSRQIQESNADMHITNTDPYCSTEK